MLGRAALALTLAVAAGTFASGQKKQDWNDLLKPYDAKTKPAPAPQVQSAPQPDLIPMLGAKRGDKGQIREMTVGCRELDRYFDVNSSVQRLLAEGDHIAAGRAIHWRCRVLQDGDFVTVALDIQDHGRYHYVCLRPAGDPNCYWTKPTALSRP